MKEQFINRYSLSKTLRFSLIPVGETENNFNKNLLLETLYLYGNNSNSSNFNLYFNFICFSTHGKTTNWSNATF